MKTIKALILFAAIALAVPNTSYAGRERGDHFKKIMAELDLSQEQKDKMKTIKDNHRNTMKVLRDKKSVIQDKLQAAFNNKASDSDLKKIHTELLETRNQIGEQRFEKVLAVRNVLTPEQRETFDKMKGEKVKRWRGRNRHRGDD